ncbi:hypothetical protein AVEN_65145-1 [Araneus ventricosus]|uniref:Uncharacterized protein n=1 Tax=Araneus ventricosus TaxID=182803 RepID=A0A4Y2AFN9_ARAVE|nr:hypothetical protein AVEN_65145-1 [Araneus ventricosus]
MLAANPFKVERDPGLLLATPNRDTLYVAMFLYLRRMRPCVILLEKISFSAKQRCKMDVDSLQEHVYSLEPLSCCYKNANCKPICCQATLHPHRACFKNTPCNRMDRFPHPSP